MIAYARLYEVLKARGVKPSFLREYGIHPKTQAAIMAGTCDFKLSTLDILCRALDCQPGDILEYVPDEGLDKKPDM